MILRLPELKRAQSVASGFSHHFQAMSQGHQHFGLQAGKFSFDPCFQVRWYSSQRLVFLQHARSLVVAPAIPAFYYLMDDLSLAYFVGIPVPAPLLWLRELTDLLALLCLLDWNYLRYDLVSPLPHKLFDLQNFPGLHFIRPHLQLGWWISLVIDQILTKQAVMISCVMLDLR